MPFGMVPRRILMMLLVALPGAVSFAAGPGESHLAAALKQVRSGTPIEEALRSVHLAVLSLPNERAAILDMLTSGGPRLAKAGAGVLAAIF